MLSLQKRRRARYEKAVYFEEAVRRVGLKNVPVSTKKKKSIKVSFATSK